MYMNFNVYLNKEIGEKVKLAAKALHCSRNSIINVALEEWLNHHLKKRWPPGFFDFKPVDLKLSRSDLEETRSEDPLK